MNDQPVVFSPEGHWFSKSDVTNDLVYVAQKEGGSQEMLRNKRGRESFSMSAFEGQTWDTTWQPTWKKTPDPLPVLYRIGSFLVLTSDVLRELLDPNTKSPNPLGDRT